jgi:hypothetical protein
LPTEEETHSHSHHEESLPQRKEEHLLAALQIKTLVEDLHEVVSYYRCEIPKNAEANFGSIYSASAY